MVKLLGILWKESIFMKKKIEKFNMDIGDTGDFIVSYRGIIDGKGKNLPQNLDHKIILLQEPTCLDKREEFQVTGFSKFKPKNEMSQ